MAGRADPDLTWNSSRSVLYDTHSLCIVHMPCNCTQVRNISFNLHYLLDYMIRTISKYDNLRYLHHTGKYGKTAIHLSQYGKVSNSPF